MPKKTAEIIKQSGNEYVLQVKSNQKKLLEQITLNSNVSEAISIDETVEQNRGRDETRRVFVYDDLYGIDMEQWIGIKEIVKVERVTYTNNRDLPSLDTSYYRGPLKIPSQFQNSNPTQ